MRDLYFVLYYRISCVMLFHDFSEKSLLRSTNHFIIILFFFSRWPHHYLFLSDPLHLFGKVKATFETKGDILTLRTRLKTKMPTTRISILSPV
jgi:hypothetical protein